MNFEIFSNYDFSIILSEKLKWNIFSFIQDNSYDPISSTYKYSPIPDFLNCSCNLPNWEQIAEKYRNKKPEKERIDTYYQEKNKFEDLMKKLINYYSLDNKLFNNFMAVITSSYFPQSINIISENIYLLGLDSFFDRSSLRLDSLSYKNNYDGDLIYRYDIFVLIYIFNYHELEYVSKNRLYQFICSDRYMYNKFLKIVLLKLIFFENKDYHSDNISMQEREPIIEKTLGFTYKLLMMEFSKLNDTSKIRFINLIFKRNSEYIELDFLEFCIQEYNFLTQDQKDFFIESLFKIFNSDNYEFYLFDYHRELIVREKLLELYKNIPSELFKNLTELIFKIDIEAKIIIEGFVYSGLLNNLDLEIKNEIFKFSAAFSRQNVRLRKILLNIFKGEYND